ncbi:beta-lactamase family protein [bacterium]|nr:beta-lactamase family protein [bacterium]
MSRILILGLSLLIACEKKESEESCSQNIADTLTISIPSSVGVDSLKIESGITKANSSAYIFSLLILKNNLLISENYFKGKTVNDNYSIRSVTKTIVSALTGIAIKENKISSIDKKVKDFFPEYFFSTTDPLASKITIKHLLTMTAGYHWNEAIDRLYGNRIEWAINLPMDTIPGRIFNYSSAVPHILSGILTRATHTGTLEFADKNLFQPLQIQTPIWDKDPQGFYNGGSGLNLTARDMAKVGFLYLNHGCYGGQRIVNSSWVDSSGVDQTNGYEYGYLWWIGHTSVYSYYYALGYGGQMIFVVPDLALVMVTTANPVVNDTESAQTIGLVTDIFENDIIPAFLN